MATTNIYAGGGRRSAAPKVSTVAPTQAQALISDDKLLKLVLAPSAVPLATATTAPTLAFSLGSGSFTQDTSGVSGAATTGSTSNTAQGIGLGLSALGMIANDPTLGIMGGAVNAGDAAGKGNYGPAASLALGLAGVPNAAIGVNAVTGNTAGVVNAALGAANPVLGLVNSALGLAGVPSLGSLAAPAVNVGLQGLTDAAQIAIGTIANAFSTPNPNPEAVPVETATISGVGPGANANTDPSSPDAVNGMDANSDAAASFWSLPWSLPW